MSITATGETLYDLRIKLGFHYPQMSVSVVLDALRPKIRVTVEGETRSFTRSFEASRYLRRVFDRKIRDMLKAQRPMKAKAKKRRRR